MCFKIGSVAELLTPVNQTDVFFNLIVYKNWIQPASNYEGNCRTSTSSATVPTAAALLQPDETVTRHQTVYIIIFHDNLHI